jgi:hypothetical protein
VDGDVAEDAAFAVGQGHQQAVRLVSSGHHVGGIRLGSLEAPVGDRGAFTQTPAAQHVGAVVARGGLQPGSRVRMPSSSGSARAKTSWVAPAASSGLPRAARQVAYTAGR